MNSGSGITPTTPSGNTTSPNKGQVVQIVSLPEGLENNARAIRLEGEVVQQNKDGSVRIQTPEGSIDITIRGRQPQPGQKIEIDIPPGSPPRQANIRPAPPQPTQPPTQSQQPPVPDAPEILIPQTPVTKPSQPVPQTDGTAQPSVTPKPTTPEIPQTKPLDGFKPTPETTITKPLPPLPPLTPGQIVKLVPLPAIPENPQTAIVAKVEAQATVLSQKSEGNLITTLLQAVKSALPQSILPQAANGTLPQSTAPSATKTPIPQQPLVLSAKVISLTLPSGQTLSVPTPTTTVTTTSPIQIGTPAITPPPLVVTVTQLTPQNQPVIPIPMNDKGTIQNFVLQSPPATIPVGTQMTIQPQITQMPLQGLTPTQTAPAMVSPFSTPTPVTQNNPGVPPTIFPQAAIPTPSVASMPPAWRSLMPLMQSSTLWPVMDEIFQTFYQATPQAAQILGRTIPSPSNAGNFGPALMLFAAAIKSGDLQTWMGEKKLEMIQKLGKGSLMSRLSGETSSLSGNTDAASTDWKSFPVPLLWQNEISKIMFHVRKEPSENEQENGEGGTRFVMDLSLTRMGEVQLDGMVRGKQLDLIVRTQMPVSAHMQEAMRIAYAKALDGTDIFGDIGFQSDRTNWENILAQQEITKISI